METYIPQPTQKSLSCKTLRSPDSRQLKSIVDNRTETVRQKRLLDTINTAQQVIQCTDGELCDEVRENKPIAPDKNFTAKHVRTPINNTDAIRTHAYREEPSKINTLIDDNTLDLKNIVFESNLPSTPDSTPYHDSELVKTTCNIQETELKNVAPIPSGYFDLVEPETKTTDEIVGFNFAGLKSSTQVMVTFNPYQYISYDLPSPTCDSLIEAYRAGTTKKVRKKKNPETKRKLEEKEKAENQIIQILKDKIQQDDQANQQARDAQWTIDQQTWAGKVKEKFSRIGNQNLKDTAYTTLSEIDNIPIIGSKEILIGIGKNEDENIFAFHYDGHK